MARSRIIKPEFWDDERLATVSMQARLTYIGLWNFCDDYGVTKASLLWLKSRLYPFDEKVLNKDLERWLIELCNLQRIIKFSVNGDDFYYLPNFLKHQVINRPSKTRYPEPSCETIEHSLNNHGALTDEIEVEIEKKEKKKATQIELPDWLNKELWKEFHNHRKAIKSPLTHHAEKLCLDDLKKLVDAGFNQDEIINNTIKSGKWKSFFKPNNNNSRICNEIKYLDPKSDAEKYG